MLVSFGILNFVMWFSRDGTVLSCKYPIYTELWKTLEKVFFKSKSIEKKI